MTKFLYYSCSLVDRVYFNFNHKETEMSEENIFDEDQVAAEDTVENENDANEEIRAAFDEAVQEDSDEDSIKLSMIAAGASFKNVTRLFNQFMIDAGLAISKADRSAIVEETMEGLEGLETEEGFNDAVAALVESVQGASEKSAAGLVRAYCKKNELECYKKPKGEGSGRTGFTSLYHAWLVANPSCTEEEATAYIMGENGNPETSDNTKRHKSYYIGLANLANAIAAK